MKKFLILLPLLVASCGYSSSDNELTGQVKRVQHVTPLICPDYDKADVSLGVMRNGVGSMSTEDVWLTVDSQSDVTLLETAAEQGALVKVHYSVKRVSWCVPDHRLDSVELVK